MAGDVKHVARSRRASRRRKQVNEKCIHLRGDARVCRGIIYIGGIFTPRKDDHYELRGEIDFFCIALLVGLCTLSLYILNVER